MNNKSYPRVQIIINADSNAEIQDSVSWLSGTVKQSATEWPSESPATKIEKAASKNINAEGTPPDDVIHVKSEDIAKTTDKKVSRETPDKAPSGVSLDDLRKKMSDVLKSGKRDEAKALLAEFGSPKLGELDEAKYADFSKGLDELLGGH
jgi:hypothetical protein